MAQRKHFNPYIRLTYQKSQLATKPAVQKAPGKFSPKFRLTDSAVLFFIIVPLIVVGFACRKFVSMPHSRYTLDQILFEKQ